MHPLLSTMALSVILAIIFVASLAWLYTSRPPKGFPPTPGLTLPFMGHAYLLGADAEAGFSKLRQKLGDIFGLNFGPNPTVVMCDFDSLQEAMSKEGLLARPKFFSGVRKCNLPDGSASGN